MVWPDGSLKIIAQYSGVFSLCRKVLRKELQMFEYVWMDSAQEEWFVVLC